jgi:transposase-like protein
MKTFASILEFQKHFDTDEKCREFLEQQRWNGTPACPFCGSLNVTRLKNGKRFQCNEKECRNKFSVTVGTILQSTKIPLTKWFLAMYILSNHSKGISSLQLSIWLGVTQKTAWFLNHRIREMLKDSDPQLLKGLVEVDETFVGGKLKNRPKGKRDINKFENKTMVFGAVEREGKVITKIIPDQTAESLINAVRENVEQGAVMVSDEHVGYTKLAKEYQHVTVIHSKEIYVIGSAHTNTIEGFWNLLKKQINGIHHSVSPKHLQRYCNEAAYRYNRKHTLQDSRFSNILLNCEHRLKYKDLISKSNDK